MSAKLKGSPNHRISWAGNDPQEPSKIYSWSFTGHPKIPPCDRALSKNSWSSGYLKRQIGFTGEYFYLQEDLLELLPKQNQTPVKPVIYWHSPAHGKAFNWEMSLLVHNRNWCIFSQKPTAHRHIWACSHEVPVDLPHFHILPTDQPWWRLFSEETQAYTSLIFRYISVRELFPHTLLFIGYKFLNSSF